MLPYINLRKIPRTYLVNTAASDVNIAFQYISGVLGASTDERKCSLQPFSSQLALVLVLSWPPSLLTSPF
jgi:hypothetical protein